MKTSQGNRAGRSARIEPKFAALSGDFGMNMLRAKFADDADAILAALGTYSRGPRKGMPRGYIHWEKVAEGGFDYRNDRRCVVRPGTQNWRVLDSADSEHGKDIAGALMRARSEAEEARKAAEWEALTPRQRCVVKAQRARASAHRDRLDGDRFDFIYNMKRARRYIREAREH